MNYKFFVKYNARSAHATIRRLQSKTKSTNVTEDQCCSMQDYVQRTDTLGGDELIDRKIQKMKVRMMMMKS